MKEPRIRLMNRREFLQTGACSTALLLATPCWGAANGERRQGVPDEAILSQTGDRIEKYRKGEGLVAVRDPRGQPLPGVRVQIEQIGHEFLFGCNLFMFGRCGGAEPEDKYRRQFAALLNYCTLGFYWSNYELERGRPNYDYTNTVVEWACAQGITAKGHPLVWDHPAGSPRWLPDDRQQIQRLSDNRVHDIVSRFKDRINVWDVVNEATHLPDKVNNTRMADLGRWRGPVPYTREPLQIARAANSHALLLVNDYRTDQPYYDLLSKLQEEGKDSFDVIGIQSHMHGEVWPLQRAWDVCDKYSKLGRPIHFTETTIVSGPRQGSSWGDTTPAGEATQAEKTVNFYRTLFAHSAVQAITWWDFSDLHAWQGAAAGWLREDMSAKPVYERLKSLIKGEWWTKIEGRTGASGEFATRAFYGTYRISIEPPAGVPLTKEVHWQPRQSNRFLFQLP